ncbi:MAG TPA: hypothetical protein VLC49_11360 [Solirubrobacteraceae bacterium]|nr:hypothetical protein [Solirubrobacteraceae bacterium]
MATVARLGVILLSLLIALGGCGGGGGSSASADTVEASFTQWVHDLQRVTRPVRVT